MRRTFFWGALLIALSPYMAPAQSTTKPEITVNDARFIVKETQITEWKAVAGRIEAKNTIPARARLGGTLTKLTVTEGKNVTQGQVIAQIIDAKLDLQLGAINAQIGALQSQFSNAKTELTRGQDLLARGVTTAQRIDALRTQVSVLANRIDATNAEKRVIEQRANEGAVLAPITGKILDVPVTAGSVVMAGEIVATLGGGGFFLRLAVPERHAAYLVEGAKIQIGNTRTPRTGTLAKLYPKIENGRVIGDVQLDDINADFINARVLVRLPIGTRSALIIPADMVITRMGLDFVDVKHGDDIARRTIITGQHHMIDNTDMVEVITGLREHDIVVTPAQSNGAIKKAQNHD